MPSDKSKYAGKGKRKQKDKSAKAKPEKNDQATEPDNEHDFGGIPDRDLRKNLGCGG